MKTLKKDQFFKEAETFIETGRLMNRNPDKFLGIEQFSAGSNLPHPDRSALVKNLIVPALIMPAPVKEIADFLRMTAQTTDFYQWHLSACTEYSFSSRIMETVRKIDQAANKTITGNSMAYMLSFRSACAKPPVFQIEDRLLSLLDQSDIGADLTVGHLENLPFDIMYVEMGATRSLEYEIFNIDTGMHRLEGFYILKSEVSPQPYVGNTITLVFVGEPKGNVLGDAIQILTLETGSLSSSKTLHQSINLSLDKCNAGLLRPAANSLIFAERKPALEKLITLAAKCILYLNHGKYHKVPVNDLKAHNKIVEGITNPSKKEKAIRSGYKLSDRILIRHQEYPEGTPSASDLTANGGVSAHWRRGHFRNQRYGEKLGLVKPLWIAPTLVGRERARDESKPVTPKNYEIKGPSI